MATQPITSAHKRSHRLLNLDVGAIFLAASLATHWQDRTMISLTCGVAGVVVMAIWGYQAVRRSRRQGSAALAAGESAADSAMSQPHHP